MIEARAKVRFPGGLLLLGAAIAANAAVLFGCDGDDDHALGPDDAGTDSAPDADPEDARDAASEPTDARTSTDGAAEPVVCTTTPCATQIAGAEGFFCALLSDGTVSCWGTDVSGSLGSGVDASSGAPSAPTRIEGLAGVTQISARQSACALQNDGVVKCWGRNDYGQLGLTDTEAPSDGEPHPVPSVVALAEKAVRVDVNDLYTCAVLASGKLACWGLNNAGLLARGGPTPYIGSPALASIDDRVVRTTTGSSLSESGAVRTWGLLLGRESSVPVDHPSFVALPIPSLTGVTEIAAEAVTTARAGRAEGHACVIANGEVYCWGNTNKYGELCTGLGNVEETPARVSLPLPPGVFPQQLALTSKNTCVRATDGTVLCCGVDDLGQLGGGAVTDGGVAFVYQGKPFSPTFRPARSLEGHAVQVAINDGAACALLASGEVKCWGSNRSGQLGTGARDDAPHPTPVRVVFP